MKSLLPLSALVLVSIATAACAAPPEENAASSENAVVEEPREEDQNKIEMKVEDLDGDGLEESFTSTRDNCGTGGCQWTIHLSRLGEAGELFAKTINPLPRGSEDEATSFFAYARGGLCYGSFVKYVYEGGQYHARGDGIDCNEVIKRPEGAPIAQFEGMCFEMIPLECRDLP